MMCVLTQTTLSLRNLAWSDFTVAFLWFSGEKEFSLKVCVLGCDTNFSPVLCLDRADGFHLALTLAFFLGRPKLKGKKILFFHECFNLEESEIYPPVNGNCNSVCSESVFSLQTRKGTLNRVHFCTARYISACDVACRTPLNDFQCY